MHLFPTFSQDLKTQINKNTEDFFKFNKTYKFQRVDFSKSWISFMLSRPWLLLANIINVIIYSTTKSAFPLILAHVISLQEFRYFGLLIGLLVVERVVTFTLFRYHPRVAVCFPANLTSSAYQKLLTVDPIAHSTKSSGQIISKIQRAAGSVRSLFDSIIFSVIQLIVSILVAGFSVFQFSVLAGSLVIIFGFLLAFVNWYMFRLRSIIYKQFRIKAEDQLTAANVESMQQAAYIRSIFATDFQVQKLLQKNNKAVSQAMFSFRLGGAIISTTMLLFYLGFFALGWYLYSLSVNPIILTSILLIYYDLGSKLFEVGRLIDSIFNDVENISDLFEFINNFGKQSYPVLD